MSATLGLKAEQFNSAVDAAETRIKSLMDKLDDLESLSTTLQFDTDMNTGDSVKKSGEQSGKTYATSFGSTVKALLTSNLVMKGVDLIGDFVKDSVEYSSSLTEVQNVIDTAFGDSAEAANEWARNAKENYGMNELTAKQYLSNFRSMWGTTMGVTAEEADEMAMTMTGLVGDWASFRNTDYETAYTRLKSVITGSTEAIDEFGISMHAATLQMWTAEQGYDKLYKEMDEGEKRVARYNYLLEMSGNVTGDFVKTQGSYANQTKLLSENFKELGGGLLGKTVPALAKGLQLVNSLFGDHRDDLQKDVDEVTKSEAEFKTALDSTNSTYGATLENEEKRVELAEKHLQTLEEIEGKGTQNNEDIAALKEATAALLLLYPELTAQIDEQTGSFTSNAQAIRDTVAALGELRIEQAAQALKEQYQERYSEATINYTQSAKVQSRAANELDSANQYLSGLQALSHELNEKGYEEISAVNGQYLQSIPGIEKYFDVQLDGTANLKKTWKGVVNDIGAAQLVIQNAIIDASKDVFEKTEALTDATKAMETYKEAMEQVEKDYQDDLEMMNKLQEAQKAVQSEAETVKETLDSASEAGNAMQETVEAVLNSGDGSSLSGVIAGLVADFEALIDAAERASAAISSAMGGQTSGSTSSAPAGITHAAHFATGLNSVPFDNFPAFLHRGEAVLSRAEADEYRMNRLGQAKDVTIVQNIQSVPLRPSELAAQTRHAFESLKFSI